MGGKDEILGEKKPEGITRQARNFADGRKNAPPNERLSEPPRLSRAPPGADPDEIKLYEIFKALRGKDNLPKKEKIAQPVLIGEYGIKNELLAKLMMGPTQFETIIKDKGNVVPPLIELLSYSNIDVRVKAAKALGELGDARALPALYRGLDAEEYWVRNAFAESITKMAKKIDNVDTLRGMAATLEKKGKEKCGILHFVRRVKAQIEKCSWSSLKGEAVAPPARICIAPAPARGERPDTTLRTHVGGRERLDTTKPIQLLRRK